jgi:uracil-DNA glycosylase family 4
MATDPRDLAEHLRYYVEIGIAGFSRDHAWRARPEYDGSSEAEVPGTPPQPDSTPGPSRQPIAAPAVITLARSRQEALSTIVADLGDCTRCKLHRGRTNIVFGVGSPDTRLMFVGEGPGADEDEQGIPFVGRAGQLLTQIIKAMGFERDQVYIANVVKCRPPDNRNPEPDEIERCEPFLMRQIDIIKPAVIVALGKFAAQTLLRTTQPISRLRGQFHRIGDIRVMPTFHPSYLLRNPSAKREVWEDMKLVMAALREDEKSA